MLGISAYFNSLDLDYIKAAAQHGARYVFTSLQLPEDDLTQTKTNLLKLIAVCEENDLILVPDISPQAFDHLGLAQGDFDALRALGIKAIRLDYGFDDWDLLVSLQQTFTLFINASTIDEDYLSKAGQHGLKIADLHAAHNFYPKPDTGLAPTYFRALNHRFLGSGVQLLAFIPGDELKRYPFYAGLPTLEDQRGQVPLVSAVQLINDYQVDDILCGDSKIKLTTLAAIRDYQDQRILTIPVIDVNMPANLFNQEQPVRKEVSEKLVRLNVPRVPEVEISETGDRPLGTITQDNRLAARYSGEVQISKRDLPFSAESNIIGYVHPAYLGLLPYIDGKTRIRFVKA